MSVDVELILLLVVVGLLLPILLPRNRRRSFGRRRRDTDRSTEAVVRYLRAHFDP